MALLNEFKLGADPEFVIQNEGNLIPYQGRTPNYSPWGIDHGGWVIEPHPKPETSVRQLIQNLKVSFNDFAISAPTGKWRAGAYLEAPQRTITLGGHVHIDKPTASEGEVAALDLFTKHLEALDILPQGECVARRGERNGYGRYGDIRIEHGHYEYRSLPSWLFSQRVTKICLAATKLIVVDPAAPSEALGIVRGASLTKLKTFFERFSHKDDDADWILGSGMLDKKLVVRPDRDLRDVWSVEPKAETPHWKEEQHRQQAAAGFPAAGPESLLPVTYAVGSYVIRSVFGTPITGLQLNWLTEYVAIHPVGIGEGMINPQGEIFHVVGRVGFAWSDRITFQTWVNQVDRRHYKWRLLATQVRNQEVRARLRRYVLSGSPLNNGRVVWLDGLMVQPLGEVPDDDELDF